MNKQITVLEALYRYYSGYGPTSMYTLAEWFEARDIVRSGRVDVIAAKEKSIAKVPNI